MSDDSHGEQVTAPPPIGYAIRAVRWSLLGNVTQRLITFGSVAVLARLLSETEFGAYRQILSVHLVIFVLLPLGFDQLYVREIRERRGFVLLLGGALSFSAAVVAIAALAGHALFSRWMNFEHWSGILWMFPAVVAVQARKLVYKTDLAARLDYRKISLGETFYALVSGLGGVALSLAWPSAWSLYLSYSAAEIAELLWLRRGTPVRFPPVIGALRVFRSRGGDWKRFSLFHSGNQVLNAVGGNAPVIIFGAALSKAAAAAFSMASLLVTVPIYVLIGALHRVAFSALAGRSREELKAPVLQMLKMSAAFIVPVLVWVAVMAEPLVGIVLGPTWVESTAPVARLLSMYCVFAALFSPVSSIDILLDRPDYGFYWNVVATAIRVAAVVLGLRYGVTEAVVAYAVSSAILWLAWGVMLAHLLGAGQWVFHWQWLQMTPLWLMFWAMLAGALALVSNPWMALISSVLPAVVLGGLLLLLQPKLVRQGMRLVQRRP